MKTGAAGEATEHDSREYEAAVSEGWPVLPDSGGLARRRCGPQPEGGRTPNGMRTTTRTVRFSRPFVLVGVDDAQPAGAYVVETDEELLPAASVSAYRRISTLMRLPPRPGSNELVRVIDLDPLELSRLLASDAVAATAPLSPLPGTGVEAPRAGPTAARRRV